VVEEGFHLRRCLKKYGKNRTSLFLPSKGVHKNTETRRCSRAKWALWRSLTSGPCHPCSFRPRGSSHVLPPL
jgi:hypothetical protein